MLVTFDTKQAYEAFAGHGFSDEQAEILTEFLQRAHITSTGNLATKNDLKLLESELRSELQLLEQRTTIKLGGIMVIGIGLMTAIPQLFG